jgi:hypothetical protein
MGEYMSDYYEEDKEKKRMGCGSFILIILLLLAVIIGSAYFFLPKIISSAISGGVITSYLPDNIRRGTEKLSEFLSVSIERMEKAGLSTDEASLIVSSLDYESVELIFEEIEISSISNSSDMIDLISQHVDLSVVDIDRIKEENYTVYTADEMQQSVNSLRKYPILMKFGFRIIKQTVLNTLSNHESSLETIEEPSPGSGSTKKKKKS